MTPEQQQDAQRAAKQALATLFREIFEVDARGRKVLEHLERRWLTGPAVITEGGIDAVLKTYRGAAHRELLDYIHTMIASATREPVDTPEALT